jgi:CBS domain containing-hemolysin-like protein
VRLQYYVNKGEKRALWIHSLIQKPSRLFGTTLLGVTISLQVGSECSRQLYLALGLNPDFALLTQFFLVVIIAELAPIFAARRYAESVSMMGVPLIYASSIIMAPLVWVCGVIANGFSRLIGGAKPEPDLFLSRDEVQRIVEQQEEGQALSSEKGEFNLIVSNIFHLKNKIAKQVMTPLAQLKMIASNVTVGEMRRFLQPSENSSYIPVYHRYRNNIVAMAFSRDLIRIPDNRKLRDHAKSPWFVTEQTTILQILNQFRHNNQNAAIVLDEKGHATGLLALADILEEIYEEAEELESPSHQNNSDQLIIDRSFPGEMRIEEFNKAFGAHISTEDAETLEELITNTLGPHPQAGESIRVDRFELTVEESTLLGIKTITIRTIV